MKAILDGLDNRELAKVFDSMIRTGEAKTYDEMIAAPDLRADETGNRHQRRKAKALANKKVSA